MPTMKVIGWLVLLGFVLWCWSLIGADFVRTDAYEAHADAMRSGAIERGWLPREMPASATKILETYVIDTSEIWMRFNVDSDGIDELLDRCTASTVAGLPNKRRTLRNAPWWPVQLTTGNEVAAARGGWSLRSCPEMHHAQRPTLAGVAVNRASGTVWYWVN
jgi:hypothetical protein